MDVATHLRQCVQVGQLLVVLRRVRVLVGRAIATAGVTLFGSCFSLSG